jgi:GxxExxY protein
MFLTGRREDRKTGSFDDGSDQIIGACIEVHRHLGPGLLEKTYEQFLCHELELRGLRNERQLALHAEYKGVRAKNPYRLDIAVESRVIIEVKHVERLLPVHEAQLLTYLKLSGMEVGLLVNFNVRVLKHGLRRMTLRR